MAIAKDLTGKRFGKLLVLERVKNPKDNNKNRHSFWLCKCDCGNEIVVIGTSLTKGTTKSCGCLRKSHGIDMTGKKFGKLTVIKKVENSTKRKNRSYYWLCKCECGNEKIVSGVHLRNGNIKSCGCDKIKSPSIIKYNKYNLSGEYGVGYTSKGEEFYFDLEDYEKIKDYCWSVSDNKKYIINSKTKNRIHRLIMNCSDDNVVDHINHNPLDNRKSNLRVCTLSQNGMNKRTVKNNNSGYNGVTFEKATNKWRARIGINKRTINLGRFEKKEDAITARKNAEEKYFGKYSYDNSMKLVRG